MTLPLSIIVLMPLLVAMFLALSTLPSSSQTYRLQFDHPSKVNDEYDVTIEGNHKATTDTLAFSGDDFSAELRAHVKVLAVNAKTGGETHIALTVNRFLRNGKKMCTAGTKIDACREAGMIYPEFRISGALCDKQTTATLRCMLPIESSDADVSMDNWMGTDQPVKVGSTWPINPDAATKATDLEGDAAASGIAGEGTLKSVRKVGGIDVMDIEIKTWMKSWSA